MSARLPVLGQMREGQDPLVGRRLEEQAASMPASKRVGREGGGRMLIASGRCCAGCGDVCRIISSSKRGTASWLLSGVVYLEMYNRGLLAFVEVVIRAI